MSKQVHSVVSMPAVFHMSPSERDKYLSQVGSFTQEQHRIFHRICDFLDPALDYSRFVLHAGEDFSFSDNQIESLMKKLRSARLGLLVYRAEKGSLKPHRIVLCDRDSREFYLALLDDEMQKIRLDDSLPWPTIHALAETGVHIPRDLIENISANALSPGFVEQGQKENQLYNIGLSEHQHILVPSSSLNILIEGSRARLLNSMKQGSFLEAMSRILNVKISELQKKVTGGGRHFWEKLTRSILENREGLQVRFKFLNPSFFQSCEILGIFQNNAVLEEENERKDKAEKEAAMEELCKIILQKDNFLVGDDEFLDLIKVHEKRWVDFKEYFYTSAVKAGLGAGLARILYIGGFYIHRDHLYPWFRAGISSQSAELKSHYIELMTRMLRFGTKSRVTVFYTRDMFLEDINDMIQKDSPALAELLTKPKIVSEGIVHYFKNIKKVRDIGRIKDFMNTFFDQGRIRFKEKDALLGLYLFEIFEEAYAYLPLWRRIFLRLSGKKESLSNRFSTASLSLPSVSGPSPSSEEAAGPHSPMKRNPSVYGRQYRRLRAPEESRNVQRPRRKKKDESPAAYNLKERNKAWMEFEDAFYRKKGKS